MQSLSELFGFIPVTFLSLKVILAVAICLLVLVRKTPNSPLRLKDSGLNMVVEAIDIQSLYGPSLVDSRSVYSEMD